MKYWELSILNFRTMKKVIYIPKTNIIQFNKAMNSAFRGYPIYLSSEDLYNPEFKNSKTISKDIIKFKESLEVDSSFESTQKNVDSDNTGNNLEIPGTEFYDEQENSGTEDKNSNDVSPEVDTDLDNNEDK